MSMQISVGGVKVGGGAGISIQSMTNTKTHDIAASVEQICGLAEAGCDIVRLAVPDMEAARALGKIRAQSPIPMVADIHFDYRLALEAIAQGADKIRINPGNIRFQHGGDANAAQSPISEVAAAARKAKIPIRVGINSGSLPPEILKKHGISAEGMVQAALESILILNTCDFDDICVSLKSSDVRRTIEAYRLMHEKYPRYPLHLGVTEAGLPIAAAVKSALGIGSLLMSGIGDTIRVSVTGAPAREVEIAREILTVCGLNEGGVEIISCPGCGRCNIDLVNVANEIRSKTRGIKRKIKVAIMGCAVNGPGEARDADIGIAGGAGDVILFKKGVKVRKIAGDNIINELLEEIHGDL
ncbi:MAG: flavodoxin-dependent (E)-4-hydroxy-3-methylbut-2-enyl-diphosphate synthase [Clostridiales bacterium]|jgi:(E)-4-hydroxy-3-methylbut-2-enyl-diphosphate synthase|nr:flavodoxin-dependent (E)-4-hydroxy-3-methylbut-2-enyl-diphosphate synthase [Clostridiales bacterium]